MSSLMKKALKKIVTKLGLCQNDEEKLQALKNDILVMQRTWQKKQNEHISNIKHQCKKLVEYRKLDSPDLVAQTQKRKKNSERNAVRCGEYVDVFKSIRSTLNESANLKKTLAVLQRTISSIGENKDALKGLQQTLKDVKTGQNAISEVAEIEEDEEEEEEEAVSEEDFSDDEETADEPAAKRNKIFHSCLKKK